MAVVALIAAMTGGLVYWTMIKPASDTARDFMRQGKYARAADALAAVNPRLQWWPGIGRALERARFGARLHEGIHTLAPELERLRKQDPNASDVLVFQGLRAYWVSGDVDGAIEFFTQAARRDPEHIEAHLLAAGRLADRAYAELVRGDDAGARNDVSEASGLLRRLQDRVSFADKLPQVAGQSAELLEIRGEVDQAYATYARLASTDLLSAVQAAMISWRLADSNSDARRGLESAQSALNRLKNDPKAGEDAVGWSFRVGGTGPVIVRGKVDKLCLTSRIVGISQALVGMSERGAGGGPGATGTMGALEQCPAEAAIGPIHDVVCVQLLAAVAREPAPGGARAMVLDAWRTERLRCDANLKAPAVLPPGATADKTAESLGGSGRGGQA